MRILIIEDEQPIVDVLTMYLEEEGHQVLWAADGDEGLRRFEREQPDFVVLDLMLPGRDGFELCRRIRARSTTPILILTARGDEMDRLVGFEFGADDYVVKPFSPREVAARIRVISRRARTAAPHDLLEAPVPPAGARPAGFPPPQPDYPLLRVGALAISPLTREAWYDGEPLPRLTPREFELLTMLVEQPRRVFTKAQLEERLFGYDAEISSRALDMHVSNLRAKLPDPSIVETVRGVGYRVVERPAKHQAPDGTTGQGHRTG